MRGDRERERGRERKRGGGRGEGGRETNCYSLGFCFCSSCYVFNRGRQYHCAVHLQCTLASV